MLRKLAPSDREEAGGRNLKKKKKKKKRRNKTRWEPGDRDKGKHRGTMILSYLRGEACTGLQRGFCSSAGWTWSSARCPSSPHCPASSGTEGKQNTRTWPSEQGIVGDRVELRPWGVWLSRVWFMRIVSEVTFSYNYFHYDAKIPTATAKSRNANSFWASTAAQPIEKLNIIQNRKQQIFTFKSSNSTHFFHLEISWGLKKRVFKQNYWNKENAVCHVKFVFWQAVFENF